MPNVNNPQGLLPQGTVGGSTPGFRISYRKIAANNATPIFTGDPVVPVTGPVTGYIRQLAEADTVPVVGVFLGCEYLSISQGRKVWSPFWPGFDANGDVTAHVIDDPQAQFVVQAGATAIGLASLNLNVAVNPGNGNTITGRSGAFIENPATTATLPFMVTGFVTDPPGQPGTDIASPYNLVLVTFNNQIFRTGNTAI